MSLTPLKYSRRHGNSRDLVARQGQFEPFIANDPRLIASTAIRQVPADPQIVNNLPATVRHYNVVYTDAHGKPLGPAEPRAILHSAVSDTLDLLAYSKNRDGTYLFAEVEVPRPVIARRSQILPGEQPLSSLRGLPGGYLMTRSGRLGLRDVAEEIIREKIGAPLYGRHAELEFLGGSYFASSSFHTEHCFPRAVRVALPQDLAAVRFGAGFQTNVIRRFLSGEEILSRYSQGEGRDLRLVESVLRFHRMKGLAIPDLIPELTAERHVRQTEGRLEFADADQVRRLASNVESGRGVVAGMEIAAADNSANPYLTQEVFFFQHICRDGKARGPEQIATAIRRRGVDSVDLGAFFIVDGEPYQLLQRAPREIVRLRNESYHPIKSDSSEMHLEGLGFGLSSPHLSDADLHEAIGAALRRKAGVCRHSQPRYVGECFTSPGFSDEKARQYLIEIDPVSVLPTAADVFAVRSRDILTLSDQGVLRDARASFFAHLLVHHFAVANGASPGRRPISPLRASFLELVNSTPHVIDWIVRKSPRDHATLCNFPTYTKVLSYGLNEVGVDVVEKHQVRHHSEAKFFREDVPLLFEFGREHTEQWVFGLLHDTYHWLKGGMLPFKAEPGKGLLRDEQGQLIPIPFEKFNEVLVAMECDAVWYSDIRLTNNLGVDRSKELTWRGRNAEAFQRVGYSIDQARAAIISIERDGIIPDDIIRHPAFLEYRDVFQDKLLVWHVLDGMQHKLCYEDWAKMPDVAEVAYRFGHIVANREDYESRFKRRLDELDRYSEGINPFKASIARTMNRDLHVVALRLAWYRHVIRDNVNNPATAAELGPEYTAVANKKIEKINRMLEQLLVAHEELENRKRLVVSVEPSPENLESFQRLLDLRKHIAAPAHELARNLEANQQLFTKEQLREHQGRLFPMFRNQEVYDEAFVAMRARELFENNLARVTQSPHTVKDGPKADNRP